MDQQKVEIRKFLFAYSLIILSLIHHHWGYSQEVNDSWRYSYEIRGGVNLVIYDLVSFSKSKPTKGPGTKGFLSFMISGEGNSIIHTNYAFTLVYYQKSLGSNFNPIFADYQIDIINSFGMGLVTKESSGYYKYQNTLSNNPSYNYRHDRNYGVLLATNWILNSSKRNQWVGSMNITLGDVSINYYNDGGPGINAFGLGDRFDRYWTGGGGIRIHNKDYHLENKWESFSAENLIELTYNQFTGYSPLAYEISNVLGIDIPSYKESSLGVKTTSAEYNASSYDLRINLFKNVQINAGIMGSLRSKGGKYWGIQDIIHLKQHSAFHPNNSSNRHYIGIITNHQIYENSFE